MFFVNDLLNNYKLETDEKILVSKARKALNRYGHKLVIANELNTRKNKVILVSDNDNQEITVSNNDEIEKLIVEEVIQRHDNYIKYSKK